MPKSVNFNSGGGVPNTTGPKVDGFNSTRYFLGGDSSLFPGVGDLIATGFAAVIGLAIAVPAGNLQATGFNPTVAVSNNIIVQPGTGAATVNGFVPVIAKAINTSLGTVSISGFAPTVQLPVKVLPGVGSLSATGFAPSVGSPIKVLPSFGQVTANGLNPSLAITNHQIVNPSTGQLSLAGFSPLVIAPLRIFPGVGGLQADGFAPIVLIPTVTYAQVRHIIGSSLGHSIILDPIDEGDIIKGNSISKTTISNI